MSDPTLDIITVKETTHGFKRESGDKHQWKVKSKNKTQSNFAGMLLSTLENLNTIVGIP